MHSPLLPAIIGCALALAVAGVQQEHHPEHTWDYGESKGPSHWGELEPEFAPCKNGHRQSPIDIRNPQKADLPSIQFDYKPSSLHIIDNGHTVMINYGPGSFITVGGKKYALKQFHFHRPSEETIDGKAYEMVVHLVHADQQGNLAVVAVLLQKGEDNSSGSRIVERPAQGERKRGRSGQCPDRCSRIGTRESRLLHVFKGLSPRLLAVRM